MKWITSLLMIGLSLSSLAQTANKIEAAVQGNEQPVENATVFLLRQQDSAIVKISITDKAGLATFEGIPAHTYFIKVSHINYQDYFGQAFNYNKNHLQVPVIHLIHKSVALQQVTVKAQKPFIQKLTDRIIVNVESSILNAGISALEVLERSPGVTVDQNDNVSLKGRQGVIIMIDGKPTPMAGNELSAYLKGLPSNAIDRIEIITQPSARYDAAGNSGIIDIRLKKDQRFGMNGTFNTAYSQGIYPKTNTGGTFNYRNKLINVFGSYNYAYRENLNHLIINRNFFDNGVSAGSDTKDNYAFMPARSQTIRFGADFFPSPKTIIGFVSNANINKFKRFAEILTLVNDKTGQADFSFLSIGTNDDAFKNGLINLNLKHRFDSSGRELTIDADYGRYRNNSLTRTASTFYELDGSPKKEDDILDGDQEGDLHFRTAKGDYVHPLSSNEKLEIGLKTSIVSSDNVAKFYNVFSSGPVVDDAKTNQFFYTEYNNAGYINFSGAIKKFSYQLGLRGEQTRVKTRQVKQDIRFANDYFKLFPSAFLNYKAGDDKTVGISVSRRIDRPGYNQLNPFLFQVDATIYSTGAPNLKPQMTWSYELTYTYKNMHFNLGHSHTRDPQTVVLSRILDVIPNFEIKPGQDSNITVQIPVNLLSSDYIGLTANIPVRINKWWSINNNLNAFYNHYNGDIGGAVLNNGRPAINVRSNNNFTFSKGWSAEVVGSFNSGNRYAYMVMQPQWSISIGGQKNILKDKGNIRLNISDIFWTNLPDATINYPGNYIEHWHAYRETRVATLSFSYRFGNNKVQTSRKRTTASEEERQRAN